VRQKTAALRDFNPGCAAAKNAWLAYSITRSARASTVSGIVMPSAFASVS
jgi:hypothetical protein